MSTLAVSDPTTNRSSMRGAREKIRRYANRALARLRIQEALRAGAVVLTISFWLLALLVLADRLFSLQKVGIPIYIPWAGLTALGIPYILWRAYAPRIHEQFAAVLADDRLDLHARISTALSLDLNDPASVAFSEAFFMEALRKLDALNVEKAFPIKISRAYSFLAIPLLCAYSFNYIEQQDALGLVERRENKHKAELAVQKAAKSLEARLQDMKAAPPEHGDEQSAQYKVSQIVNDAKDIAKQLNEGKRSPDEAMAALGQLKQQIEQEKEKISENKDFLSQLEKLSAKDLNLEDAAMTRKVSEALKMGDPSMAASEMRKLAEKVQQEILDDPNKTEEQKKEQIKQLKGEVEKLAGALAEDRALKQHLQDLSNTLDKADFEKMEQEIAKSEQKQSKTQKKLGDDVKKEIEDVAKELEKVDEEGGDLSEEDEKEMEKLDEVEEGVDNAIEGLAGGEEGKQAQQSGEQNGQEASGQPGGKQGKLSNGASKKRTASKKMRGKAGSEVAQNGGQDGKQGGGAKGKGNGNEDGKGQHRPGDGESGGGQGIGSRAYNEGADPGFKQEKVKGHMQAGTITGMTHFRGQGSKGDAPADFVQALRAADQDRESSLELDRVPSDARDVVKDYFSRVKQDAGIPEPAPGVKIGTPPAPGAPPTPKGPATEPLKE